MVYTVQIISRIYYAYVVKSEMITNHGICSNIPISQHGHSLGQFLHHRDKTLELRTDTPAAPAAYARDMCQL